MKKIPYLIFLLVFLNSINAQKDSAKVKFTLIAPNISSDDTLFITGNSSKIGGWSPDLVPLTRINDTTFSRNGTFKTNTTVEYKFTKGSWATEALNDEGFVQTNNILFVTNDTVVTNRVNKWKDEEELIVQGQITGQVDYIDNVKTRNELEPRNLLIWLPPGYEENINQSYPVLYMHDGQNIFDPATSFLGTDWQVDETADSLIRNNIIEPIIIVGLYNTANRSTEYSENDTGYAYIDFLVNDVKPMIDENYRTNPDRENTAVAGSSMGGLISFMIAWERPDVFGKAACLSPAFKIRKYNYVDNVKSYIGKKKDVLFYIDNGTEGLEDSLQTGVDEMLNTLSEKGYKAGNDYVFYRAEGAEHNEAAWALRNHRFLKLFFGKEK